MNARSNAAAVVVDTKDKTMQLDWLTRTSAVQIQPDATAKGAVWLEHGIKPIGLTARGVLATLFVCHLNLVEVVQLVGTRQRVSL
jgi:hypothetical protein